MRFKKYLRLILINLIVLMVGIEILCIGAYYQSEGYIFYGHDRSVTSASNEIPLDQRTFSKVLHPVLGLTNPSGVLLGEQGMDSYLSRLYNTNDTAAWGAVTSNNYGFYSNYDYPYDPPSGDLFIVAIVGGSVAQWLVLHSEEKLIEQLQQSSIAKGKEVIVLNFAQGGFKQPQQLQAVTYFLSLSQPMDLVINIDGFNEIALGAQNIIRGIDIGLPNSNRLLPLVGLAEGVAGNRAALTALAEIERLRSRMTRIETWQSRSSSAAIYIGLRTAHRYYQQEMLEAVDALEQRDLSNQSSVLFSIQPARIDEANGDRMEALSRLWGTSSLLLHQLLEARGIAYVHVLQPNQYFSSHTFSAEETRVALNENSPFRDLIQEGYPYLKEQLKDLEKNGIHVVDATGLFDDVDESVYGDSCCHLNDAGTSLLTDAIVQSLAD